MLKEDFARRLRETINQSGKSISNVAMRSKIPRSAIQLYLDPKSATMPTCHNLVNLCKELHISADYLLFGEERIGRPKATAQNQETKQIFPSGHLEAPGSS